MTIFRRIRADVAPPRSEPEPRPAADLKDQSLRPVATTCGVVARAARSGVTIGLIGENVVLPMREALASRLDGTYYRAQVDRHLLRRLRALAARRREPDADVLAPRAGRRRILADPMPTDLERTHQSTWARTPTP